MSEPMISAEGLGKRYMLRHHKVRGYQTLRDTVAGMFQGSCKASAEEKEEFWALKNISFEVGQGEVVGVIGRNGAGKSTLLKILSRITEPTEGRVTLNGRVASLLEVGTGFHPELTGRENIRLNGAILGMRRQEIEAKFDEIVAFAEVERFLDTPVKHYSSGMYVRLAFSVAAHLEPEILIVDEVLAVGDAAFQTRCLGRMQDVAKNSGRTVFFVSHNLGAIRQLTSRCLFIEGGSLVRDSDTDTATSAYLASVRPDTTSDDVSKLPRIFGGTGEARFISLRLESNSSGLLVEDSMQVIAEIESTCTLPDVQVSLTISTQEGVPVGSSFADTTVLFVQGRQMFQVRLCTQHLSPGHFQCTIALSRSSAGIAQLIDAVAEVLPFEVVTGVDGVSWCREWGSMKLPPLQVVMNVKR